MYDVLLSLCCWKEAAMAQLPLHLYLLGSFRIERGARPIHLSTRKVESLLAFLALHPEEHPREKLAALFWGDSTDEQARGSLRTALNLLRAELDERLLRASRETVQFNPDFALVTDAREFEKIGDSAISNLQSLLSLYHGDLLPDFYDDWVLPERERLRALYLAALLRLIQHFRSESKYERAIEWARKLLATDPANEKAYQHLMFCYAAMGDRSTALKQYDECARRLRDELGVEPARETITLRDQIQEELSAQSREALFTNLPNPLTSFIGRENELAEIHQRLETSRLVTLVGAGGCGKTRLAIQVASGLAAAPRFKQGAWWVDLAPLNDSALVATAVAATFHLRESPPTPLTFILIEHLRAKEILLVLDNCEHLFDSCARLAQTLLTACPRLSILATSRSPLGLAGEVAWRVPSMSMPDPDDAPSLDQLTQFDAARLFDERATAVVTNWKLADHASTVARICARLDGIPLAIELAAARLKVLSAEQIAARLDDCFDLLTAGSRTALPRHQTLRAAMDWSFDLLSEEERELFRRLAVFAGGFSLEAVEAVSSIQYSVNSSPHTEYWTLNTVDLLTSLIDKSLVGVEQKGNAMRYRLLETVRQYAREKLVEANEFEASCARHRDWFLQLAEQADPKLRSGEQMEWFARLELEMENLRAALAWSLGQTDDASAARALRLAGALVWFWIMRGYIAEGRTWLERSLENCAITPARAKALVGLAAVEYFVGTRAKCRALCDEALVLYRQQGDKWGIALSAIIGGAAESDRSRSSMLFEEARLLEQELKDEWLAAGTDVLQGGHARRRGDLSRAGALFESALDHARRSGDRWMIGNALVNAGHLALDQGEDDRSTVLYTEALKFHREMGDKHQIANILYGLGIVAWHRDDCQQADALLKQSLTLRREIGDTRDVVGTIWALGRVATTQQRYERAARLLGSADVQREIVFEKERRAIDDDVRTLRAQVGEAMFDKVWAEGRAMSLHQATEYALENVKTV